MRCLAVVVVSLYLSACDRLSPPVAPQPTPSEVSYEVRIQTLDGAAIAGATVYFLQQNTLALHGPVTADGQGRVAASLPAAPHWIGVAAEGFLAHVDSATALDSPIVLGAGWQSSAVETPDDPDETDRPHPFRRAKAGAVGRGPILGDVNGSGRVDRRDAYLLFQFALDPASAPAGNLWVLGDVNGNGVTDWTDLMLLGQWLTAGAPRNNSYGIGQEIDAFEASLEPDPSRTRFSADGAWHTFTVRTTADSVLVVVNEPGTDLALEIAGGTQAPRGNFCGAERSDSPRRPRRDGWKLHLAGCAPGRTNVVLKDARYGMTLASYRVTVGELEEEEEEDEEYSENAGTTNRNVRFWSNSPDDLTLTSAGVVTFDVRAYGLEKISQFEIEFTVSPVNVFGLESSTFDPHPSFSPSDSEVGLGTLRVGARARGSTSLTGTARLGRLTLVASSRFGQHTRASIRISRISLGPNSTDRAVYRESDIGIEFEVDPYRQQPPSEPFNIELVFLDNGYTREQQGIIRQAAEGWEAIIEEGVPSDSAHYYPFDSQDYDWWDERCPTGPRVVVDDTVDDLRIFVCSPFEDDEILGWGGPFWLRLEGDGGFPVLGTIRFNQDLLDNHQAELYSTAFHEMAHVLGFGTWRWDDLLMNPSEEDPGADTHFPDLATVTAFNEAGGRSYSGGKVPVENQGDDSHWREDVFGNEMMTPTGSGYEPLSAITLKAMAALGYRVNMSQAVAFRLPDPARAKPVAAGRREGRRSCRVLKPPQMIQ